jgi:cytochrome c peroxidase
MIFKTASLRNVEKTGPYFHDASSANLQDAVHRMAVHQLGIELKPEQTSAIVSWLKTLTGEIDKSYIAEPKLPKSTAATPKPDKTL